MEKNDKVHLMEEKAYRFGKKLKKLPLWGWGIIALITMVILFNIHYSYILSLPFLWFLWYVFIRIDDKPWIENYPTLEEYWRIHPDTKTKNGIKCYYCGSNQIKSYLWNNKQGRRVHYCFQCRQDLYRTKDFQSIYQRMEDHLHSHHKIQLLTQYAGPASDNFLPIEEQYSAVLDNSQLRPKSNDKTATTIINKAKRIFLNTIPP